MKPKTLEQIEEESQEIFRAYRYFNKYEMELCEPYKKSVRSLLLNFDKDEIIEAIGLSCGRGRVNYFKYACGILWNKKKEKEI